MFSMSAFTDELVKISDAGSAGKGAKLLGEFGKPLALLGSGALLYHLGKKEVDKYLLGRQVYEQMQARE